MVIKVVPSVSVIFKNSITYNSFNYKSIKGKILENNSPFPCRVRLFEKPSGVLISEILTDNEGNYEFKNLSNLTSYFLIAHHPESKFNAVVQDNIIPE